MKTIKVSYPILDHTRGDSPFPQQSPGGKGIWGNYQFVFDNDEHEFDYWVVVDEIPETQTAKVPKQNTIFLTTEPPSIGYYPTKFLNQFGIVATCHRSILNSSRVTARKIRSPPLLAWHINKTYDELAETKEIPKTKLMSCIVSKKNPKRYKFALKLKEFFGDDLDLFGRGINEVEDKWDALAPYKYTIVLENERAPDYFSEKILDAYLAGCYPIYYGCSNLYEYFHPSAFTPIWIKLLKESISDINKEMGVSKQVAIHTSRGMCLNYYNFYPAIIRIINHMDTCRTEKQSVTIEDKSRFVRDKMMFVKKMIRKARGEA